MKFKFIIGLIGCTFSLGSCVSSYQNLTIENHEYPQVESENTEFYLIPSADTVSIENKKFLKKQLKHGLWLIPVKAINNSENSQLITKDRITVFNSYVEAEVVTTDRFYKKVRYSIPGRTAIGLASIVGSISFGSFGTFFNYRNPLLIVAALSPFSVASAIKTNKQLQYDLNKLSLLNKRILPGDVRFGIICIRAENIGDIYIRLEK